jgi:hypothetical protein
MILPKLANRPSGTSQTRCISRGRKNPPQSHVKTFGLRGIVCCPALRSMGRRRVRRLARRVPRCPSFCRAERLYVRGRVCRRSERPPLRQGRSIREINSVNIDVLGGNYSQEHLRIFGAKSTRILADASCGVESIDCQRLTSFLLQC